jgi:AbrB family looped-hinge helix DNA binding protein
MPTLAKNARVGHPQCVPYQRNPVRCPPGSGVKVKDGRTRVDSSGRVVIPASFRRALGIQSGDAVVLRMKNDELRISTLRQGLAKAQRLIREHVASNTSLVDELIAERRDATRRE